MSLPKSRYYYHLNAFGSIVSESIKEHQSNPEEKEIIKFLPGGYYAMSELINKIGDIKDIGICSEEMLVVGKIFGLSPIKIQKLLGDDYLSLDSVVKSNKALIVNYVKKEKILLHMADYLDSQIK
jgi:hypothetical protein